MRHILWRVGVLFFVLTGVGFAEMRVINGNPVPNGTYGEVVQLKSSGALCTATVIGPRTIITAAHCTSNDASATFTINGTQYNATMTLSPLSPDHNIALGITDKDVTGVQPAFIGGVVSVGTEISILGYGCIYPNGGGGNDGILRIGDTVVTAFASYNMISRKANGAAICSKDGGGPAFLKDKTTQHVLVGVNSMGNMQDTNYDTQTGITETKNFFNQFIQKTSAKICGFNSDCGTAPATPPKCTLAANPNTIKLGESISLTLSVVGQATSGIIENQSFTSFPAQKTIQPPNAGTFTAHGSVTNSAGSASCSAIYVVQSAEPQPPICTLTATPEVVQPGGNVTLNLVGVGQITSSSINGTSVSIPSGSTVIAAGSSVGTFTANGKVVGPGGTGACSAIYTVQTAPPSTPDFTVVPSYCGENSLSASRVYSVCLGILKHSRATRGLQMSGALIITYRDSTKEVLPIVLRQSRRGLLGDSNIYETLTVYTNTFSVSPQSVMTLGTQQASLTKTQVGVNEVPAAISGRSAQGAAFQVNQLSLGPVKE